ncbi:MAG: alpha/beta hydrolase [Candidatus Eisenbacteria bacterium]
MSAPVHAHGVRLQHLTLPGPAGTIEALLQERDGFTHRVIALVCHPHPLYGGTMHNKVVHRIASTLLDLGVAVLRFNFRGAGGSDGRFDQGRGEVEDARAMAGWLRDRHPEARRWVAGFSFGSFIAARLAATDTGFERMTLVAPPVASHDFSPLRESPVPKLVLQGTADDICPLARLEEEYPDWAEPKRLILIPDASHFFDKQLHPLGDALLEGLREAVGG